MAKGARGGRRGASPTMPKITNRQEAIDALKGTGLNISAKMEKKMKGKTLDENLMIENASAIVELESQYGVIGASSYAGLDFDNSSRHNAAVQSSSWDDLSNQTLIISANTYRNKQSLIEAETRSQNSGFHPETLESKKTVRTITHEYGHMMHNNIIKNAMAQDYDKIVDDYNVGKITRSQATKKLSNAYEAHIKSINDEIIGIAMKQNPKMSRMDIKKTISKYGNTNEAEFFAESFASAHGGKPDVLGKAMQTWLKQGGYKK